MWKITDRNGTVYSGNEDEIKLIYQQIVEGKIEVSWEGDLKLIQIHAIYK